MAMSLEDLLAKEGFKRSKSKMMARSSFASEGRTVPLYAQRRNNQESSSLQGGKRTERTRSDIPRYDSKGEFSTSSSFKNNKPRENLTRMGKNIDFERKGHRDSSNGKRFSFDSSEDAKRHEITEIIESDEIVEVGNKSTYKDVYLNKVYVHEGNRSIDRKNRNNESRSKIEEAFATPALDEAALKAVISILNDHVKRFLKDEDFRTSLRHNSFASFNFIELNTESKVIENLEQAIEIAERAVEENIMSKELKRASLQLSVITGLNSNDLKDGYTSGIANYKLSACAHLYLSVIYMLEKKDRISAKHVLQVFCDSPFQARSTLLTDLWDRLFLPHFSHLKQWYEKEARFLTDSPVSANSKLLEKLYTEVLDSGTHQFALYYKDWLAEGIEEPSIPLVKIPSFSASYGQTSSPASNFSPRAIVSKKLYDEVFRHANNTGVELKVEEDDDKISESSGSLESPGTEEKQLILYNHDSVTYATQNYEPDKESESFPLQQTELDPSVKELQKNYEDLTEKTSLFTIPKDFICPLTGLLFEDPVTLETGQTFERESVINWFDNGCITCPVTRKTLLCQAVPNTNLILKRVIDNWKTEHYRNLFALVSQESGNDTVIFTLEKLIDVFSLEERLINARRVISLGGLQFLLRRFNCGDVKEKSYVLPLLCCCIEAEAVCRKDVCREINKLNLLELLHSEELKLRVNAVLLLVELICFNRRNGAKKFLEGLQREDIINAMDYLLIHLKTCTLEEKPMMAVLLLHLDLLSEFQIDDMYRHEAVDVLTISLEKSLFDEKIQKKCSKALLVLGGCFSSSGKLMTEDWILKLSGFLNGPDWDNADSEANDFGDNARTTRDDSRGEGGGDEEEEEAREKWLKNLSVSLIGDGKKSFLEKISKCLSSLGNFDLVRVCLTTVAWLSSSLASINGTEFQLYAFSALISPLKNCLEYGDLVEHRILASFSLLNFSKIPECRVFLMNIAEEIGPSLENLAEVTWTANELHANMQLFPGEGGR